MWLLHWEDNENVGVLQRATEAGWGQVSVEYLKWKQSCGGSLGSPRYRTKCSEMGFRVFFLL